MAVAGATPVVGAYFKNDYTGAAYVTEEAFLHEVPSGARDRSVASW